MVFSRIEFLYLFLPALLFFYFLIRNNTWRRGVLLAFSLLFYAWGKPAHILVMLGLVAADYFFGIQAASGKNSPGTRRFWLIFSVVTNLSCLCVFKYLGFFAATINGLFHCSLPVFTPEMPIGISFFTFQTMSYVIDVYRGDAKVQKSFPRLLLYVSFFPQLIAGPIVRYKDIDRQLENPHVSFGHACDGAFRFAVGLGKKVLIADRCAAVITSLEALAAPTLLSSWGISVFFTLQLYYDFSGYSDMAIGLGRIFGFRFLENFSYPLSASSATDFWRRWHISLGSFYRDYLYIPLGGNRHLPYRNIFIVWLLTGLWHGASWNFVLWGLYYGILLTLEKTLLKKPLAHPVGRAFGHVLTVLSTVFGFSVFYHDRDLFTGIGRLFGRGVSGLTDMFTNSILLGNIFLFAAAAVLACPLLPRLTALLSRGIGEKETAYNVKRIAHTVVTVLLLLLATVRLVGNTYSPFLYFRF